MQTTTNFNLKKPEGSDVYNIANENDNMDIIDAALAKAHFTDDAASTDLVDGDYIPFYDTSASTKKKALWSTILTKLKNIFPLGSTLAPIANGPKYPGTWSAGKQFVYQGQLCKTKVNVSSSDNITVGVSGNAELASDVTSQISNLQTQVTNNLNKITDWFTVQGSATAASENTILIGGNTIFWSFRNSLFTKTGNLTCTLAYNGKYYVRLQNYFVSDLVPIFPGVTSAAIGSVIKSLTVSILNRSNNNVYFDSAILVKESATEVRLISNVLKQDTSGTLSTNTSYYLNLRGAGLDTSAH